MEVIQSRRAESEVLPQCQNGKAFISMDGVKMELPTADPFRPAVKTCPLGVRIGVGAADIIGKEKVPICNPEGCNEIIMPDRVTAGPSG